MIGILGIGTDIIECLRIAQMIERHGELFIGRVYTPHEIQYCQSRKQATQHFAGRWAAKEAVLKVLDVREVIPSWKEIETRQTTDGRTEVVLYGAAAELARVRGFRGISLSVSYAGGVVVAVAVSC